MSEIELVIRPFMMGDDKDAALKVLTARGTVDELATKWFGERIIRFDRDLNWEVSGYRDAAEYMKGADRPAEGV